MPWAFPNRFYPIIDAQACEDRGFDPRAVAAACFRGGARLLQLRVKSGSSGAFLALADDVVATAAGYNAIVVVNDRGDIARMAGAGGVHVGQDDLPADLVRTVAGPSVVIGLSTHDEPQVEEALASQADYIAVGPVFPTTTKDTGYDARGLNLVRSAAGRGKPVVAIGGIAIENAPGVIRAGASAVAVITDLLREDPERRTRAYLASL
ncbi:MAG: thiamine phosphate synthase [Vicinamibacterales bacterium]